jgi:hypothetical protein
MGSLTGIVDSMSVFHQTQFLLSDAKYTGDIVWKYPGIFWRDLGEAGKLGQLYVFGLDGRYIEILLDGRPMNDPVTGTFNLYDLPLEFIDYVDIQNGSTSIMAATITTGTFMNFVSRSYNSYRPMTKIRFVQDPKETILTDGLFTQNIARGLNLMIGIQRHASQGRYTNASLDAWNTRIRLRYNVSDRLNISLTDFYNKTNNGLNGGITRTQIINITDEDGVMVNNRDVWDLRTRRDVTLSSIARILSDSASTTQIGLYYSKLEREYRNPSDYESSIDIDDSTMASFWGLRFQQRINLEPFLFTLGAQMERRHCDSTRILPTITETEQTGFAHAQMLLAKIFIPSLSVRYTTLRGRDILGFGGGIKANATEWLTLYADVLWSDRLPTIQELYWKDSTVIRSSGIKMEHHEFIQGGLSINAGSELQLSLAGYQRTIRNAIIYQSAFTASSFPAISISNVKNVKVTGLNGQVILHLGPIEALGILTLMQYKREDTLEIFTPEVLLSSEVSYHDLFFSNNLEAKFGLRSRFYNRQYGMQFNSQTLSYVQYKLDILGRSTSLDLFMILKIGDAYISISWDNIFNASYVLAPIYPMPGRHFRIGVNWIFID